MRTLTHPKVCDLANTSLGYETVRGLEISVEDGGVPRVEVGHAAGHVQCQSEQHFTVGGVCRAGDKVVVVMNRALFTELFDNEKMGVFLSCANQQDDVGVAQAVHDCDFGAKLAGDASGEVLDGQALYRHMCAAVQTWQAVRYGGRVVVQTMIQTMIPRYVFAGGRKTMLPGQG